VKHPLLLSTLLIALAFPAAAGAAGPRPQTSARIVECQTALDQSARHLVAQGSMDAYRKAARMQMRFDLQVRVPERPRWTTLSAPGFGVWNTAGPASRRYVYSKRVENLTAPATYRMLVRFRWLDEDGRRVARARRATRACRQPDLRPDLQPRRVSIAPLSASERRYVVPVRNTGATPAGPFAVTLTVNGVAAPSVAVTGLAAGKRTEVTLDAPACEPGSVIGVRVDSDGTVDERDEGDDELLRPCPEG